MKENGWRYLMKKFKNSEAKKDVMKKQKRLNKVKRKIN